MSLDEPRPLRVSPLQVYSSDVQSKMHAFAQLCVWAMLVVPAGSISAHRRRLAVTLTGGNAQVLAANAGVAYTGLLPSDASTWLCWKATNSSTPTLVASDCLGFGTATAFGAPNPIAPNPSVVCSPTQTSSNGEGVITWDDVRATNIALIECSGAGTSVGTKTDLVITLAQTQTALTGGTSALSSLVAGAAVISNALSLGVTSALGGANTITCTYDKAIFAAANAAVTITALPASAGLAAEATSDRIIVITVGTGSNLAVGETLFTMSTNLAVNPAAGAVAISCVSTTDTLALAVANSYTTSAVAAKFFWDFTHLDAGSATTCTDLAAGVPATTDLVANIGTSTGVTFAASRTSGKVVLGNATHPIIGGPTSIVGVVNWEEFRTGGRLLQCGAIDGTDDISLDVTAAGDLLFGVARGSTSRYMGVAAGGIITAGKWYHIVATVESTTMKTYVDGVLIATITNGQEPDYMARASCWIAPFLSTTVFFSGSVLNFGIHDYALSAAQVAAVYEPYFVSPLYQSVGKRVAFGRPLLAATNWLCWRTCATGTQSCTVEASCGVVGAAEVQFAATTTVTGSVCGVASIVTARWLEREQNEVSVIECTIYQSNVVAVSPAKPVTLTEFIGASADSDALTIRVNAPIMMYKSVAAAHVSSYLCWRTSATANVAAGSCHSGAGSATAIGPPAQLTCSAASTDAAVSIVWDDTTTIAISIAQCTTMGNVIIGNNAFPAMGGLLLTLDPTTTKPTSAPTAAPTAVSTAAPTTAGAGTGTGSGGDVVVLAALTATSSLLASKQAISFQFNRATDKGATNAGLAAYGEGELWPCSKVFNYSYMSSHQCTWVTSTELQFIFSPLPQQFISDVCDFKYQNESAETILTHPHLWFMGVVFGSNFGYPWIKDAIRDAENTLSADQAEVVGHGPVCGVTEQGISTSTGNNCGVDATVSLSISPGAEVQENCEAVILSGSASGGIGAPLHYEWLLVHSTAASSSDRTSIELVLNASSSYNDGPFQGGGCGSATVEIPAVLLKAGHTHTIMLRAFYLEISGAVMSANTTQVVSVSANPIPSVKVDEGLSVTILRSSVLSLTARGSQPGCSGDSTGALTYAWSVAMASGFTGAVPAVPKSANPSVLTLPANTENLDGGKTYVFTVTVAMQSNPSVSTTTTVNVVVIASPLHAAIAGASRELGRASLVTAHVVVDGSGSCDPDVIDVGTGKCSASGLSYAWVCQSQVYAHGTDALDSSTTGAASSCLTNGGLDLLAAAGKTGRILSFDGSDAVENRKYVFTLTVGDSAVGSRATVAAAVGVAILPGVKPLPMVTSPTLASSGVLAASSDAWDWTMNSDNGLTLFADVDAATKTRLNALKFDTSSLTGDGPSMGEATCGVRWLWSVSSATSAGGVLTALTAAEVTAMASTTASDATGEAALVMKVGALTPGKFYTFSLAVSERASLSDPSAILGSATTSLVVKVNVRPANGGLTVFPTTGIAMGNTTFTVSTSGWLSSSTPLRYEYAYRLLGATSDTLISSAWTTATSMKISSLPAGNVTLLIYAIDSLGARSAAASAEVVVAQMQIVSASPGGSVVDAEVVNQVSNAVSKIITQAISAGDQSSVLLAATTAADILDSFASENVLSASDDELRQVLRDTLYEQVETAGGLMSVSPTSVAQRVSSIEKLSKAPRELSRDLQTKMIKSIKDLATTDLGVSPTATSVTSQVGALSNLLKASDLLTDGEDVVTTLQKSIRSAVSDIGTAVLKFATNGAAPQAFSSEYIEMQVQRGRIAQLATSLAVTSPTTSEESLPAEFCWGGTARGCGGEAESSSATEVLKSAVNASETNEAYNAQLVQFAIETHNSSGQSNAAVDVSGRRRLLATTMSATAAQTSRTVSPTTSLSLTRSGDGKAVPVTASNAALGDFKALVTYAQTVRNESVSRSSLPACGWWDDSAKVWASRGVVMRAFRAGPTQATPYAVCASTHLTDFATVAKDALPEKTTLIDPIGDAHLLLNYDHTNMATPIFVGCMLIAFIIIAIAGKLVDRHQLKKAEARFQWRVGDGTVRADVRDHTLDDYYTSVGIRVDVEPPLRGTELDSNGTPIEISRRPGDLLTCESLLASLKEDHTLLNVIFAPAGHHFGRMSRTVVMSAAFFTAMAVTAIFYSKDYEESRLDRKITIALIGNIFMIPATSGARKLFNLVGGFVNDTWCDHSDWAHQQRKARIVAHSRSKAKKGEYIRTLKRLKQRRKEREVKLRRLIDGEEETVTVEAEDKDGTIRRVRLRKTLHRGHGIEHEIKMGSHIFRVEDDEDDDALLSANTPPSVGDFWDDEDDDDDDDDDGDSIIIVRPPTATTSIMNAALSSPQAQAGRGLLDFGEHDRNVVAGAVVNAFGGGLQKKTKKTTKKKKTTKAKTQGRRISLAEAEADVATPRDANVSGAGASGAAGLNNVFSLRVKAVFEDADKNNNKLLTKTEIRKYFKTHPIEKAEILGPAFHWGRFFKSMDKDGDAQFDIDEFTAAVHALEKHPMYQDLSGGSERAVSALAADREVVSSDAAAASVLVRQAASAFSPTRSKESVAVESASPLPLTDEGDDEEIIVGDDVPIEMTKIGFALSQADTCREWWNRPKRRCWLCPVPAACFPFCMKVDVVREWIYNRNIIAVIVLLVSAFLVGLLASAIGVLGIVQLALAQWYQVGLGLFAVSFGIVGCMAALTVAATTENSFLLLLYTPIAIGLVGLLCAFAFGMSGVVDPLLLELWNMGLPIQHNYLQQAWSCCGWSTNADRTWAHCPSASLFKDHSDCRYTHVDFNATSAATSRGIKTCQMVAQCYIDTYYPWWHPGHWLFSILLIASAVCAILVSIKPHTYKSDMEIMLTELSETLDDMESELIDETELLEKLGGDAKMGIGEALSLSGGDAASVQRPYSDRIARVSVAVAAAIQKSEKEIGSGGTDQGGDEDEDALLDAHSLSSVASTSASASAATGAIEAEGDEEGDLAMVSMNATGGDDITSASATTTLATASSSSTMRRRWKRRVRVARAAAPELARRNSAAAMIQQRYRLYHVQCALRRLVKWKKWYKCRGLMLVGKIVMCIAVSLYTLFLAYICILYGVKFPTDVANAWLISSSIAIAQDVLIAEPLGALRSIIMKMSVNSCKYQGLTPHLHLRHFQGRVKRRVRKIVREQHEKSMRLLTSPTENNPFRTHDLLERDGDIVDFAEEGGADDDGSGAGGDVEMTSNPFSGARDLERTPRGGADGAPLSAITVGMRVSVQTSRKLWNGRELDGARGVVVSNTDQIKTFGMVRVKLSRTRDGKRVNKLVVVKAKRCTPVDTMETGWVGEV